MQQAASEVRLPRFATPFIGRQDEIAQLIRLFNRDDLQLVTLTGPGGSGKTRLAIEVANQLDFADGVYFVPLQPLRSADNIVTTIVEALRLQQAGGDPQQYLLDYLRKKHLLLVLDNFEHLLDGVGIVTDILNAAPQVNLLVTSRERLNLQAEQLWPVQGLDVPDSDAVDALDQYSAIELFVERARRSQPDFALDNQQEAVRRICQLVDGLPLALELAASWLPAMSGAAIADELQHNIDILMTRQRDVPDRHQSMRAVFDHSWQWLTAEERAVFPKLSVFRGGFTADAAQQVAGGSLGTLASLIDKSLVRLDDDGRYDLQEVLRQYAEAVLETTADTEVVYESYSEYYARFIAKRVPDLKGGQHQVEAYDEIEADFHNIRAAWRLAVKQRNYEILDMAVEGIALHCLDFSRSSNFYGLLQWAYSELAPQYHEQPHPVWCRILVHLFFKEETDIEPVERCLTMARHRGARVDIAFCLAALGEIHGRNGHWGRAVESSQESLFIFQAIDAPFYVGWVLWRLHVYHFRLGNKHESIACEAESERIRQEIGDKVGVAQVVSSRFALQQREGHFDLAEASLRNGIALHREVGNLQGISGHSAHLSWVLFIKGDIATAQALAEDVIQLSKEINDMHARAWTLVTLSLVASMNQDYALAWTYCQECDGIYPALTRYYSAWCRAIAAVGLGRYEEARASLHIALSGGHLMHNASLCTSCLPVAAIIAYQEERAEWTVELLGLSFTHQVSPTGWMKKWPLLVQLQDELHATLDADTWDSAWERGSNRDLEQIVVALMQDFHPDWDDRIEHANQALPNPLTPRELDVLRLLAEGLTNMQIAERLFISTGTVKSHTNKIYSKLDVGDRLQATQRAQELALI